MHTPSLGPSPPPCTALAVPAARRTAASTARAPRRAAYAAAQLPTRRRPPQTSVHRPPLSHSHHQQLRCAPPHPATPHTLAQKGAAARPRSPHPRAPPALPSHPGPLTGPLASPAASDPGRFRRIGWRAGGGLTRGALVRAGRTPQRRRPRLRAVPSSGGLSLSASKESHTPYDGLDGRAVSHFVPFVGWRACLEQDGLHAM